MGKFDTHGGYFAPQGYFRINEGGSHEENPNGGVQVGVDAQGVPNMLEENEPVYDDFVFSDNIIADASILKQAGIPTKFAGRLYSEIADAFVDEAEERPNDPVSNNGLNAMLVRLAGAQENQKQLEEQQALEKELANLTPEEMAQLEQMLAAQGQEEMPQEEMGVPQEQMMAQPEQIPMAYGGPMRVFETGTPGEIVLPVQPESRGLIDIPEDVDTMDTGTIDVGEYNWPWVEAVDRFVDNNSTLRRTRDAFRRAGDTLLGGVVQAVLPDVTGGVQTAVAPGVVGRTAARVAEPVGRAIYRGAKKTWGAIKSAPGKLIEWKGRGQMIQEGKVAVQEAKAAAAEAAAEAQKVADELATAKAYAKAHPRSTKAAEKVAKLEKASASADNAVIKASIKVVGAGTGAAVKDAAALTVGPLWNRAAVEADVTAAQKALDVAKEALKKSPKDAELIKEVALKEKELEKATGVWNKFRHGEYAKLIPYGGAALWGIHEHEQNETDAWREKNYANGGMLNFFADGTPGEQVVRNPWEDFFDTFSNYSYNNGKFSSKSFKTIKDLENDPRYKAMTQFAVDNPDDARVRAWFAWLDTKTPAGSKKLLTAKGELAEGWKDRFIRRRTDGSWGSYHYFGSDDGANLTGINDHINPPQTVQAPAQAQVQVQAPATAQAQAQAQTQPVAKAAPAQEAEAQQTPIYANDMGALSNPSGMGWDPANVQYNPQVPTASGTGETDKKEEKKAEEKKSTSTDSKGTTWVITSVDTSQIGKPKDGVAQGWNAISSSEKGTGTSTTTSTTSSSGTGKKKNTSGKGTGTRTTTTSSGTSTGTSTSSGGKGTDKPTNNEGGDGKKPVVFADGPADNTNNPLDPKKSTSVEAKYPVWPRYSGAATNFLQGLYNISQKPDVYDIPTIRPVRVAGSMSLMEPQYNPVDPNMLINTALANSAAYSRALQNTGMGPGIQGTLLVANNAANSAVGNATAQAYDVNAKSRQDAIAQTNAYRKAMADFDAGISNQNAGFINNAQLYNSQNSLREQMLNNQAQGEQYQAVAGNINALAETLSGIGKENFAMNQVNSAGYFYAVMPNGEVVKLPTKALGGILLKPYNK